MFLLHYQLKRQLNTDRLCNAQIVPVAVPVIVRGVAIGVALVVAADAQEAAPTSVLVVALIGAVAVAQANVGVIVQGHALIIARVIVRVVVGGAPEGVLLSASRIAQMIV